MELKKFVKLSIDEDVRDGDHSSLSCISSKQQGSAQLLVKENGVIAGIEVVKEIFKTFDKDIKFEALINDGDKVNYGEVVFKVYGSSRSLLTIERLVLNVMQRMSEIATLTKKYVVQISGFKTRILDTRKTTPLNRFLEKEAVRIGGGVNHRFGLYDMIMLKDNHIDFAGGIKEAIFKANQYIKEHQLDLEIEIETRNLEELNKVVQYGGVKRIMLDNFNLKDLKKAVGIINGQFETEASGGINLETVREYAKCGVDFISVGALTHSVHNMDLSLKAIP
ncbi:MAG: nicotinate-nucleotide diphosphorylase (carboxylating) [Crocinitomicaceae bacterium]|nr:nicotinate-nucleotide diphosphorylase (carboxylating) [Crocinitomicaceae bacterium]